MFAAVDQAIRARLEGTPHDRLGNPTSASNPGIRLPVPVRGNDPRAAGFRQVEAGVLSNVWSPVPVFKESDGLDWEDKFPCVTYGMMTAIPQLNTWLPAARDNRISLDSVGEDVEITTNQGVVIATGKPTNVRRPHPESFDLMYSIELHSKIEYELFNLLRALMHVFPQRSYLSVGNADGTTQVLDMLIQGDIPRIRPEPPALEGLDGDQGAYHADRLVVTYIVEGYIDTTWAYLQTTHPAVTGVELEMTETTVPDADDVSSTSGVLEVIDLTKLM